MQDKYIVYSSYLSFHAPTECKYAILDTSNQDEAIRIMKHTPYISSTWEEVKVCRYSPEIEAEIYNRGRNITEEVLSYLRQFPLKAEICLNLKC